MGLIQSKPKPATMQRAYDNGPNFITAPGIPFEIQSGTGNDVNVFLALKNNSGSDIITFDGLGNVTLTGLLDGRDIADDGTKLDGIQVGATDDQTAGEIEAIVSHNNLLDYSIDQHRIINDLGDSTIETISSNHFNTVVSAITAGNSIKNDVVTSTFGLGNNSLTGEQTLNGVTTSTSRVIVTDQTDETKNGIYDTSSGAWARSDDYDGSPSSEVANGDIIHVNSDAPGSHTGTSTKNKYKYVNITQNPITVDTTELMFVEHKDIVFGTTSGTAAEGNDSRILTQDENNANLGTNGVPSNVNRFVTDSDPRNTNNRDPNAHTHIASEITDFDTEVGNNSVVTVNTAKVSADGSITTHSDVTGAGSGIIISTAERSKLEDLPSTISVKVISQESDLPAVILAPDGVMRHPLAPFTKYFFDTDTVGAITLVNGLLWPSYTGTKFFATTEIETGTVGEIRFSGPSSETFIQGENVAAYAFTNCQFVSVNGGKFIDLTQNEFVLGGGFADRVGLRGWGNLGDLRNFSTMNWRTIALTDWGDSLKIHNTPTRSINISGVVVVQTSFPSANAPVFILTGGGTTSVLNTSDLFLNNGEDFIGISKDFNSSNQINISNQGFGGAAGTGFFQRQLTGSITAVDNLISLITGSVTAYADDGLGRVLVTHAGHDAYVGLKVIHSGTTNYNGTFTVVRKVGVDQYVMDATYVGDEGSGSYTGQGIRMTAAAHKMSDFRSTVITGTTSYNVEDQKVYNVSVNTFDMETLYVGVDTGTFTTDSLMENERLLVKNNGAQEDSTKVGSMYMTSSQVVIINSQNIYERVAGISSSNWINFNSEQWLVDTVNGTLEFIGINPTRFYASYDASVLKDSGGADKIACRMRKTIAPDFSTFVEIPSSQSQAQNSTTTGITGQASLLFKTGEKIDLATANLSTSGNVLVELASFILKE